MSTLKVTHLQNENNSAPSISISSAVGGGVTFAGISTFHGSIRLGTDIEGHPSADDLTIATSGDTGMTIRSGTSNQGSLYFSDATSGGGEYAGWLRYSHQDSNMTIGVAENERLRITSSGNVNIGPSANANDYGLLTLSQSASAAFNALVIQQGNTAFTATDGLHIGIDAGVHAYFKLYENRDIYFTTGTSNTEKLRISNDDIIETGSAINGSGFDGNQRLRIGREGDCNIAIRATASVTASTGVDFGDTNDDRAGRIQYMHDGDYMSFHTNGAGSGVSNERLRITSDGKLLLPTGSLGIQFGSPDSNGDITSQTLDDYEEGTWTPVPAVGSFDGTVHGKYTKIGRMVMVEGVVSSPSNRTSTTTIQLRGLPFSIGSNSFSSGTGLNRWIDLNSGGYLVYYVNGTTIEVWESIDGAEYQELTHSDFTNANAQMFFSLTYNT